MLASPIGRYQPGISLMHRLDARVKVICLMVLVILMVTVTTPTGLALAATGILVLVAASHVAPKIIWASVRPIVPFVAFVAVFNLFMAHGGTTLAQLGPLTLALRGPSAHGRGTGRPAAAHHHTHRPHGRTRVPALASRPPGPSRP